MRTITLTQNKTAWIDDADYERVSLYKWQAKPCRSGQCYAHAYVSGHMVTMHRFILKPAEDMQVDHISGNGLDNRRSNMRVCTQRRNSQNMRPMKNKSSAYKGVSRWGNRWSAYIRIEGKKRHLGYFDDETDAARAYNKAAERYFGQYARVNEIIKQGQTLSLFN